MRWEEYDDPEGEKELLEGIIKEHPDDAEAYYELAAVYAYLLDFFKAIELSGKAIGIDPSNATYYALRSFAHTQNEEHEEAIQDLVDIIELGADESDYYVDVAQGAQRGMDKEYVLLKAADLRNEGKVRVADKLLGWLYHS